MTATHEWNSDDPTPERVVVRIPAKTEFVRIVRAVVSTLAARLDFSYEEIDDLRIAVDEACAHLLAAKPPGTVISVRILQTQDDGLEVSATSDAASAAWPPEGTRRSLAYQVLSALTESVTFERSSEGPVVQFTKHRLSVA